MKVILLEDIENIGKKYEVKEVKSGYARNFLLVKNLAKAANKENLKWLANQKEAIEQEAVKDLENAQKLANKLDGLEVTIPVKVGEGNQLFEGVSKTKIADELKKLDCDVKKNQILLEKPIKELGEFSIKINLDHNLETEIKLLIVPEEAKEI